MTDTVIRVENLGKRYLIGHQKQERYTALRDVLANKAKGLTRLVNPNAKVASSDMEEFWALKDVSFEVKQGDRVGIIGRNGAGKSTLLKILSRITEPTEGRIKIKGRVASLLEVGTGFHPELTGRENIYLNGAILGMGKQEIRRKFDEIVAFAEVEKFLDTPVKRYSSGMYVRLAFAVAAHLEPEILIVDEVLAVGDAAFQKKCLGKMEDVGKEGRTVLFVSHNMAAIQKLCSRGIVLKQGKVVLDDFPDRCTYEYFKTSEKPKQKNSFYSVNHEVLRQQKSKIKIKNIKLFSASHEKDILLQTSDNLNIQINYKADPVLNRENIAFGIKLKNKFGLEILRLSTTPISGYLMKPMGRSGRVKLEIKSLPLTSGNYFLDIEVSRPNIEYLLQLEEVVEIEIHPKDVYKSGLALDNSRGILVIPHYWTHTIEKEV